MRRLTFPLLLAAAAAGCVSVAPMPDPRGALRPGQRLVVALYQSPGPWIIDAADSKAEAAAKISPVGFLMQTVQDEHTLSVSKDLQQYMPRPHYGLEVEEPLLKALKARISSGTVQTGFEAGIAPAQLLDWNKAKDQLDWRARYYSPDPDSPAPRDYARILTLDDALILDVNLSFGTAASDDGRVMPQMSADSRVYRDDTSHLIWEHEDAVTDQVSSSTLVDFKLSPSDLTQRIEKLAPRLADAVTASFAKAFGLAPAVSTAPAHASTAAFAGNGGGLVPASYFQNMHGPQPPPSGVNVSSGAAAPPGGGGGLAPASYFQTMSGPQAPPAGMWLQPRGVAPSTAAAPGVAVSSSPVSTSSATAPSP